MKRFQDYSIGPLRMDYDDEDVFLDTNASYAVRKSSSYHSQFVSMASIKDRVMQELDNAMQDIDDAHDLLGDRSGKYAIEAADDRFSSLLSKHSTLGLHRKRSKKGNLRFR